MWKAVLSVIVFELATAASASPVINTVATLSNPSCYNWNVFVNSTPSAWFDANDPTTITIATGVSQWNDKSGNAKNVTQPTGAKQPVYTPGVLNGHSIVRNTAASNQVLFNSGANIFRAISGWTLFFVGKSTSSANQFAGIVSSDAGGSSRAAFGYNLNSASASKFNNVARRLDADSASVLVSSNTIGTAYLVGTAFMNYTTTTQAIYEQTVKLGSQTALTSGTTSNDFGELGLGGPANGATGASLDGDMAEFIFYPVALTDGQILRTQKCLQRKWLNR